MRSAKRVSLSVAVLVTSAFAGSAHGEDLGAARQDSAVLLAQGYDPNDDPVYQLNRGRETGEVVIDEYGRRILLDRRGRIIGVEQPRRRRFEERRERVDDRRLRVFGEDPDIVLRGRVGEVPLDDEYVPVGPGGVPLAPRSADPFAEEEREEPVRSEPLPPPRQREREGSRRAALPDEPAEEPLPEEEPEADSVPEPQAPVEPAQTTAPETDPAPAIVGPTGKNAGVQIAALQVILDRAGISPGVIDGRMGSNVNKAAAAYEEKFGRRLDATDAQALAEELDATGGPAVITYTLTAEDVAGPYVAAIPEDYAEKALLPAMSFVRPSEMLAERFHMDENYLKQINPGADFSRQGTVIKVMNVGENVAQPVARIVADKGREQVRAYAEDGTLVVAYPSTIGSSDTPSPSGTVQVNRIAFDPNYTYNPKINFKQGENDKILTIPPGPNGPVGSIWIALSKPTYGIHGTPEPSTIGKTNSHGCVRLTNWDAAELAKLVKPGVVVEFVE